MHLIYLIATGPLFLVSFSLFLCGVIYKITKIVFLAKKDEAFIFRVINFKYSFRSIVHWIFPFASSNWRNNPLLTTVTFLFHICCIVVPLFLLPHVVLLEESFNWHYCTLPTLAADFMTIIVLACLTFFLFRRLLCKKVKFITTTSDYILLILITIPFLTGFIAYHQWFSYGILVIIHIISSEILLILIPHTRLSHMFLFFLIRTYTGSEFGNVRKVKDW